MRKFVSVFFLLVVLVACGGGGGGSTANRPMITPSSHLPFPFRGASNQHYDTSRLPRKTSADARHMPTYHDGTHDVAGGFPISPESRSK